MSNKAIISWSAACALILLALNVRLIFPSLSVLLPEIMETTGLSAADAGYLTTLPMICLGLFAPLAPLCARWLGIERTLVAALVFLTLGTAVRGFYGLGGLFAGSLLAGASIAVCNVLMPVLVKRDFARHVALVTGLYVTAMNLGSAAAAAFTIPLIRRLDAGWTTGLALWALPVALVTLIWLPRLRIGPDHHARAARAGGIWKNPLAWQVTIYMGLQSSMAYTVLGWLAPILHGRGLDTAAAGLITSACIVANLLGNLLAPFLIRRTADQRLLSVLLALACGIPLTLLLFVPASWIWPLAIVQGLAQGATFATALTIIVLRSPGTQTATLLSGMAQSAGYTIGALAPLLIGLIHHWTGSFQPIAGLLAAITLGTSVAGWSAGRNRYVRIQGLDPEPAMGPAANAQAKAPIAP
ncbi:CynX/NimT family MFS transporter [Castellaniella sp.]|uniref:CynX/NimT family MFS transporter n=1 Tax=Castellaniella sp. TaxID=1955812 RepID=UPI00355E8BE6